MDHAAGGNIATAQNLDYFSLTVSEDTYVTIWAIHQTASFNVNAELQDNNGQTVIVDNLHELSGIHAFAIEHLLTTGTYYLKVKSSSRFSTGKYTVLATENFDFARMVDRCTTMTPSTGINDTLYGCQWHLKNNGQFTGGAGKNINVEPVWTGGNLGADINIAIVDDGLYNLRPDLFENVVATSNHDYNSTNRIDHPLNTHGTAVAGIIAARDNDKGVRGVAKRPRSLAGKPLAGFRATPSRRIPVLYGMVVYAIRFNNQLLQRQPTLRKRRLGENRGFRPSF